MKKRFKTVVLLLVIASMLFTMFACGTSGKKDDGKDKVGDKAEVQGVNINTDKWKGKTLTYSFSWLGTDEEQEAAGGSKDVQSADKMSKLGRKPFEDATGVTIVNRPIPTGEDYVTKIVTEVSAGMGPDIVNFWPSAKPSWMIKNILAPLSDYIDFNQPKYQDNTLISQDVKNYYTWAGKVYAMNGVQLGARMYYNKEKFVNAGLEDPLELWKQDKWNWEKFWELGAALTQDTDGDGVMDQYGYCTWFFENGFMTSNNVDYVIYDESGMPRFALDEKFVRAKQAADDTINKYKIAPAVWWDPNPQERFWNGEIAMDYWGYWEMPGMHENMGDKLGMAPFPRGPDLPADLKNRDVAETIGIGITGTAKDPDLAALYLEWLREPTEESKKVGDEKLLEQYGSQEMLDLAREWAGNSIQTDYSGFGQGFTDALNLVLNKPADKSWQQALDENRAAIQKALDDSIVNMK